MNVVFEKFAKLVVMVVLPLVLAACMQHTSSSSGITSSGKSGEPICSPATDGLPSHSDLSDKQLREVTEILLATSVDEAKDKDTQLVRNWLVAMFTHPENPNAPKLYQLSLAVTTKTIAQTHTGHGNKNEHTGCFAESRVEAYADYIWRDKRGQILAQGQPLMLVPFGRSQQKFGNLRTEEEAKNHALNRLAFAVVVSLMRDMAEIHNLPKN